MITVLRGNLTKSDRAVLSTTLPRNKGFKQAREQEIKRKDGD
jgi:hypothetical protein